MQPSGRTLNVGGLSLDSKTAVLIISAVLLLTIQRYHRLTPWFPLDMVIWCFIVPLAIILVIWRERPSAYGLRLGNWRRGLLFTLGSLVLMTPILWIVARTPDFRSYYGNSTPTWNWLILNSVPNLFSWEFFFRGFLLFGLAQRYGDDAILLQAIPFAIAHLGKPELETLSTIFGGAAFGYIARRTDSMLYPFLIHGFVQVLTIALASGMI